MSLRKKAIANPRQSQNTLETVSDRQEQALANKPFLGSAAYHHGRTIGSSRRALFLFLFIAPGRRGLKDLIHAIVAIAQAIYPNISTLYPSFSSSARRRSITFLIFIQTANSHPSINFAMNIRAYNSIHTVKNPSSPLTNGQGRDTDVKCNADLTYSGSEYMHRSLSKAREDRSPGAPPLQVPPHAGMGARHIALRYARLSGWLTDTRFRNNGTLTFSQVESPSSSSSYDHLLLHITAFSKGSLFFSIFSFFSFLFFLFFPFPFSPSMSPSISISRLRLTPLYLRCNQVCDMSRCAHEESPTDVHDPWEKDGGGREKVTRRSSAHLCLVAAPPSPYYTIGPCHLPV